MNLTNEQKEELRHEVLTALTTRHPAALSPRQIFRVVKRELPFLFEETDVAAALELVKGFGWAEYTVDELGSSHYWRATSAGVLKNERA